jgi:hypothetical protein
MMKTVWVAAYGHAESQFTKISGPPVFVIEHDTWADASYELTVQMETWADQDDEEAGNAAGLATDDTISNVRSVIKDSPLVEDQEWSAVIESWDGSRWCFTLQQDARAE